MLRPRRRSRRRPEIFDELAFPPLTIIAFTPLLRAIPSPPAYARIRDLAAGSVPQQRRAGGEERRDGDSTWGRRTGDDAWGVGGGTGGAAWRRWHAGEEEDDARGSSR